MAYKGLLPGFSRHHAGTKPQTEIYALAVGGSQLPLVRYSRPSSSSSFPRSARRIYSLYRVAGLLCADIITYSVIDLEQGIKDHMIDILDVRG